MLAYENVQFLMLILMIQCYIYLVHVNALHDVRILTRPLVLGFTNTRESGETVPAPVTGRTWRSNTDQLSKPGIDLSPKQGFPSLTRCSHSN